MTRAPRPLAAALRPSMHPQGLTMNRRSLHRLPHRVLIAGVALVAAAGACKKDRDVAVGKTKKLSTPIKVTTAVVGEAPTPEVITLTGTVVADERSEVTADTQGKVIQVMVERGQQVKMGAPLLRLDTRSAALGAREAQANLASARAQRQLAEDECRRAQSLFDKGAITKSQFEREQTSCTAALQQVEAAEARTALIAKSVADGIVRAPFAGEVSATYVSSGEWVNPGKPLLTLIDIDPLKVELSVPEVLVSKVVVGQRAMLSAVAYPGQQFGAKVTRLGGEISRTARAMVAEAVVDTGSNLLPGMFVEAQVAVAELNRPVAPASVVQRRGKTQRVFAVVDGEVEERVVQLGAPPAPGQVSFVAGVKVGDKLVTEPQKDVIDGARVAP